MPHAMTLSTETWQDSFFSLESSAILAIIGSGPQQ